MYEVLLERAAEKDLKKLPRNYFDEIISKIKNLSAQPRPRDSKKLTGSQNDWRIRIGSYRVLYEIDEAHKQIKIMKIRHRKDAYR